MRFWVLAVVVASGCAGGVSAPDLLGTPSDTSGDSDGTSSDTPAEETDAPASDTEPAPDDDPPACTALICEDFELPLDAEVWSTSVGYQKASYFSEEGDLVAHGASAAHAYIVNTNGGFSYMKTDAPSALQDSVWARAYAYIVIDADAAHTGFFSATNATRRMFEIGFYHGKFQLTYYPSSGEKPQAHGALVPVGAWHCFEWHFDRAAEDGSGHFIEVYSDGALVDSYVANDVDLPAMTAFTLGMDNHGATTGENSVYLDDVALDAERIGCID